MLMWRCAWADHRNHCQTEQLSHKTLKAFNYFPQTKRQKTQYGREGDYPAK